MFTHLIDELKAIRNTSTPTLPQIEASVTNAMTSAFQTSMTTALTSAFTQFHQLLRNDSVNIPTTTIQRVISPQHESTMHIQSPQNIGMTSTSICGTDRLQSTPMQHASPISSIHRTQRRTHYQHGSQPSHHTQYDTPGPYYHGTSQGY